MAEDPSGWSLTESDPQVFTQLLRDLGVKGLQVVRLSWPRLQTGQRPLPWIRTDEAYRMISTRWIPRHWQH